MGFKGKPTLRLDTLAPANGFAHENAHDALADVEATIYMARLIRDRAPAVWESLMPLVDKGAVTAALISGVPKGLVEYHMGVPSVRAVVGCGHHPKNPTMQAVFDLRRDPSEVLNLIARKASWSATTQCRFRKWNQATRRSFLTSQ